jgi:TonB family protein
MRPICESFSLLALTLATSSFTAAQIVVSDVHATDSKALCTTQQPVYADRDGKPIWSETDSLLKRATHCTAPKMPALLRQAELEGYVSVDILVNDTGKVSCVRLVSGHPILASSAINAAKDWTFRPMKQDGKAVWFYGHLRFHFSTGEIKKDENPCTVAGW